MAEAATVMPSAPKMQVARHGLTELYKPPDGKAVGSHVIFIHGLFGSPEKTWTKDAPGGAAEDDDGHGTSLHAIFWPGELLPKLVPRATVYTWGYDADIDNFMQPASRNSVYQHARNLLNDLCDLRDTYEDETIPFIFIAHSLGGLIVKDALNRSSSEMGTRIKAIAPNTFAICFLGTPHRGTKLAKSGRRIVALASLASRKPNLKLIQALEQNSEILDRIGDSFLQTLDKYGFQIASFCEEKEIRSLLFINMFVVKPDSAKIGHSKEETGTIPADHRNMAKFDSESDTGFSRVSKTIKRWVETASSSRKDEYQDCLQSLKVPEAGVRYRQVVKNHDRTFDWLFEKNTVQFIDWLREPRAAGPAGRLFWITGKPGSGKSTIMKHAIRNPKTMDHLQTSNPLQWQMIPFFFSDRGSEKQRAFQTMLQEILHQLLGRIRDSFSLVLPLYTRLKKVQKTTAPNWDPATLCEGISEVVVKSTSKAGICLFIDALDEHGGDNESLCKYFWDLSNKSEGSISLKICLASRPWPIFQKYFRGCKGFAIHEHTGKDIWNYATSRLYKASNNTELHHTAAEDQTQEGTSIIEVAEDVTSNAQGVFIWVRLVIDELCQGLIDGSPITILRETLKSIPHELEDLYARALTKVRWVYAADAHIILHMVLSSLSPLRTQTLLDCASWLLVDTVDDQKPGAQASRIASRTGGLLEVVNSDGCSIVQFIHQTAKDYVHIHGACLGLNYVRPEFGPSLLGKHSPLQPMARDELQKLEGPELLLLCGIGHHSFSASIVPHLLKYAKEVDNKLPSLTENRMKLALDSFTRLLDDESVWENFSAYASLRSFTAGPCRVDLAIAANWQNMVRQYFTSDGHITKAASLAALGPSFLDDCRDRIGMVDAIIDGYFNSTPTSDPFKLSKRRASPLSILPIFSSPAQTSQIQDSPYTGLLGGIRKPALSRMLESVGAVAHNIQGKVSLLTALMSIRSHPLVSESEMIDIAALILECDLESWGKENTRLTVRFEDGRDVHFRSLFAFGLHLCSVEWVNMLLAKAPWEHFPAFELQLLEHCIASNRDLIDSDLRAAFLKDVFEKDEKELRPIPADEEGISAVGWPLVWLSSQCGIVGFPHIRRGFCSSGYHQIADKDDCMGV